MNLYNPNQIEGLPFTAWTHSMHDDVTLPFQEGQHGGGPLERAEVPAERDAWGSFRLLARVGHGGFGEVYRAWDPHLEREVALKLLLPSGSGKAQSDDEYKAMLREARALASVRHPNIVPVYGIDRHDGRVGFWTDFVKGKTLSVLVGEQGAFGDREATLIGLDVTRALSAVHRAGILHRDIKAENVMREEGGRILLMDFGLSTLPTGQTDIAGSPNYMAPELWQGMAASVQSDIFSMGVLLYFLVTGEHPANLGGLTTRDAAEAIAHRRPLMDLRSDLPEPFLRTVSKAMESDPAKRFSSAGQLAAALAECLGTGGTGGPVEVTPAPVAALEKKPRTLAVRLSIAAAVLLGVAALKVTAVRQWLHLGSSPVAAGTSADANDQYIKAQELLKKSYKDANVAEAVGIFQKILKENPKFTLAQAGLGAAYFARYRNNRDGTSLEQAKSTTNDALSKQPDLALALATRARIEAMTGQPDLARQDAVQATQSDPRSPEAFAALAEAYDALGRKSDAIEQIQNAIALDDKNTMLLLRLGNYYMADARLEEAAEQWKKAVEIDPQNIFARYDLGIVDIRLDRLDDGKSNFQEVLKAGEDEDSYRALGTVFLYKGDYREAINMQKKAIALNPKDQQAWANLGGTYIWMGDNEEEADKAYRTAIELAEAQLRDSPDDPELLIDLAVYYATTKDTTKSIPLARKALALSPNDPKIIYFAGQTYELGHDRTKAIPLMARALAKGFPSTEFQHDPELAGIRNDPAFEAVLKQAQDQNTADVAKQTH